MQPARMKLHAKEHTNNPVQRPHFRGQGAKKETPKDKQSPRSRRPSPAREYSLESEMPIPISRKATVVSKVYLQSLSPDLRLEQKVLDHCTVS
jgi:hypothetical protein